MKVRFAPSPTGTLHIGGVRTALFNYLLAKQNKGVFVLRIEDTDTERSKKEYEQVIFDGLKWSGIEWDEGPDRGEGYRQSERTEIYEKYTRELIEKDKAYYCFCTKEELEAQKQYLASIGKPSTYSGKCRKLDKEIIEKNLKEKKPFVVRLKTPIKKVCFKDMLRGEICSETEIFGDFVIAKDFKEPLYNLACVIDDHEMKITHVIRGEDHISNTPRQILIYEALEKSIPEFLHLPLILGIDKRKMSKRDGSVSIKEYEEKGYLPEALINFLALLGWNPKHNQEIFSMEDLIKEFSIEHIQKSGAIFNLKKLNWINGHYIRQMDLSRLTELCIPYLVKKGLLEPLWGQNDVITGALRGNFTVLDYKLETGEKVDFSYLKKAVKPYQERLKYLSEIPELIDFLLKDIDYEKDLLKWKDMEDKEIKKSLKEAEKTLSKLKNWTEEDITKELMEKADEKDRGKLLWPLRIALSGKKSSASPFEIAFVLGKEKTLKRIEKARDKL